MTSKPQSISVKDLSAHIDRALDKARQKNAKLPPIKRDRDFIFNYPWILGFVIRDYDIAKGNLAELQGLAETVATELQASPGLKAAAGAGGARTALLIHDGHITMGYFPVEVFGSLQE